MDRNERPLPIFVNPFALWTKLALQFWGFGQPAERTDAPRNRVAVAVIPANDVPSPAAPARQPAGDNPRRPARRTQKAAKRAARLSKAGRSNARRTSVRKKRKA